MSKINYSYALISESDFENAKASEEITKVLLKAAQEIKEIGKKYPDVGIGDTSTDEEIVSALYSMIH